MLDRCKSACSKHIMFVLDVHLAHVLRGSENCISSGTLADPGFFAQGNIIGLAALGMQKGHLEAMDSFQCIERTSKGDRMCLTIPAGGKSRLLHQTIVSADASVR